MDFKNAVFLGSRRSDCVTYSLSHYHNHYELNFLTTGNTRMRIGAKDIEYNSFDFILIPPGYKHLLYESKYDKFDNYVIWFDLKDKDSDTADKIIKLHDIDGTVRFLCSEIYHLYVQSGHIHDELINIYLQGVLYHMKQGIVLDVKRHQTREDEIIDIAIKSININVFQKRISVIDVADSINISSSYLTRIFNKKLGMPPMQYINEVKIAASKELLKTSNMTIKQISEKLYFSDALYFSRIFKKYEGVSPKEYRNFFT